MLDTTTTDVGIFPAAVTHVSFDQKIFLHAVSRPQEITPLVRYTEHALILHH